MAELQWDQIGERYYETGVDRGVLYIPTDGVYDYGVAWNGLTTVTESPTGAEPTPLYADNIKYLNLISVEEFGATIEAFTYPDEFAQFDGLAVPSSGVAVGQQRRGTFGLAYRSRIGNDVDGDDHGYKIHLIYGATAAPSEKAYATVNDTPEAITFSWELTTVAVPAGAGLRPTALIVIDSTKVDETKLSEFETILYGSDNGGGVDPRLPLPEEVIAHFEGEPLVEVTAPIPPPTVNTSTNIVTIPVHTGIEYRIDGVVVTTASLSEAPIEEDTFVYATLTAGYTWPTVPYDNDWLLEYTPE